MISEVMDEVRAVSVAGSLVNKRWQALEGLPKRSGEGSTEEFNLCVGLPISFTAADIHAELTHVVLTSTHVTGAKGSSGGSTGRSMHNAGYGLRRIHLPRTRVNRREKKDRGFIQMASSGYTRTGPLAALKTLVETLPSLIRLTGPSPRLPTATRTFPRALVASST